MSSSHDVTLVLDATLDDKGSIYGTVGPARGQRRQFSGWLGLAAVITELADRVSGSLDPKPNPVELQGGAGSQRDPHKQAPEEERIGG